MTPYLADPDLTLHCGDALTVLRELPDRSVHMVCTSPPFFGLRDYGVDSQIGLESSPDEWAARLVDVFREVRRVLRDDGTLWCEIGDSYTASGSDWSRWQGGQTHTEGIRNRPHPYKPKDLLGAPWLLAFALRADGWYLRSCIVWSKPNAMPESVRDRPTTAHSYVFLFSKKPRYFYDAEALREPASVNTHARYAIARETAKGAAKTASGHGHGGWDSMTNDYVAEKNARSVWTIPTEPNALAICRICDAYWQGGAPREHCGEPVVQHFAAFPRELVRRMILAGTSERGVCPECGAPWVRETSSELVDGASGNLRPSTSEPDTRGTNWAKDGFIPGKVKVVITHGWRPSCPPLCAHPDLGDPGPATILDPFSGSGTTLLVARQLGRHAIGVELNERYCAMTKARTRQQSLLAEALA